MNNAPGFHTLPVSGSRSESSTVGSVVSSRAYINRSGAYNPLSNSLGVRVMHGAPINNAAHHRFLSNHLFLLLITSMHDVRVESSKTVYAIVFRVAFNENPRSCGSIAYNGAGFVFQWYQHQQTDLNVGKKSRIGLGNTIIGLPVFGNIMYRFITRCFHANGNNTLERI